MKTKISNSADLPWYTIKKASLVQRDHFKDKVVILVTGSSGVIGKALCSRLANFPEYVIFEVDHAGHSEKEGESCLDLLSEREVIDYSAGHARRFFRADVGEYRQLARVLNIVKPDIVLHAAAEFGRWNGETDYENIWKSNAIGTRHVIELQKQINFKAVYFSSSEVYSGDMEGFIWEELSGNSEYLKNVPTDQTKVQLTKDGLAFIKRSLRVDETVLERAMGTEIATGVVFENLLIPKSATALSEMLRYLCYFESVPFTGPALFHNCYAASKFINEQDIINSGLLGNLSIIVRPFNTYGPGESYSPYRSVICRLLYSILYEKPFSLFSGYRCHTYLDDFTSALLQLVHILAQRTERNSNLEKIPAIFNLGSSKSISNHELLEICETVSFQLLGPRGRQSTANIYKQQNMEVKTVQAKVCCNSFATTYLAYADSTTLTRGITKTMEWLLAHHGKTGVK